MERRGIETNIGNLNREIKKTNALIAAIKRAINKIREWITEVKKAIIESDMQPKEVMLADLDNRLGEISVAEQLTRNQLKAVRSKISRVEHLLEAGERKAELDPVHDQYLKIHWKGRKEKFAKEHKTELDGKISVEETV